MANPIQAIEQAQKLIDQLIQKLELTEEQIISISSSASKTAKNFFDIKLPKELNEQLKQSKQFSQDLNSVLRERQNLQKKLVDSQTKLKSALSEANKQLIKNKFETQQLNKVEKENAILTSRLATEYQKLKVKRDQAARSVQNLIAKQAQGNALTKIEEVLLKKARIEFIKYRNAVLQADAAVGKMNLSLVTQKSVAKGAISSIRSLASAFSLTSAVFIFADVVRDAFSRIREFDKEMQNMAGILRTTRPEIEDVEKVIRSVASTSIRTSNEVAKLATELFTMGKSREEVKKLLKPVNDLSIALNAPSGEAGKFLVRTLNAFGAGSESAQEYADIIAGIRSSTSLDFQKMRDSFQYIAPISRLLNKDLSYTGALVGVLADNSIKAEQAGRLLGTAQLKLASSGKSLDDALLEINETINSGASEIEVLAKAGDLFGANAAKVGAILAKNIDTLKIYEDRIRNSGGALDDLVNQQLKSVDARFKIFTSSWENLILSVEKGDNIISKFVKITLDGLSLSFSTIASILENGTTHFTTLFDTVTKGNSFMNRYFNILNIGKPDLEAVTEATIKDTEARKKNALEIDKQIQAFIELNGSLAPFRKGKKEKYNAFSLFVDGIEEANKAGRTYQDVLDDIKAQQELLKNSTADEAGSILDKIDVLERERKAWERSNKTKKKTEVVIKDSIKYFENQIQVLKKNQTATSKSSEEYAEFEHQIQVLRNTLKNLTGDFEQIDNMSLSEAFRILNDASDIEDNLNDDISILKELINIKVDEANGDLDSLELLFDKDLTIDQLSDLYEEVLQLDQYFADRRLELQKELGEGLKGLTSELVSSIFEIETQKYDERINANREYFGRLLENEELSEDEKTSLREKRDQETERLEKKKAEVEKRAFLFQQGLKLIEIVVDTAQKVAAIKANAALMSSNVATAAFAPVALAQIPLVIATGAVAAATVAAQTIPAFEKGKLPSDNYKGPGVWGEKQREVKYNPKTGDFEVSPDKATLTNIKKDDIIYPSIPSFQKSMSSDVVMQSAMMTSLYGQRLNTIDNSKLFDKMLTKFQGQIKKEIKTGLKAARFNIHNEAPKIDLGKHISLRKRID